VKEAALGYSTRIGGMRARASNVEITSATVIYLSLARFLDPNNRPAFPHPRPAAVATYSGAQSVAACRSTPCWRILALMGTKSRESIYGSSVRHSAERAAEARKEADRLGCVAWNQRMLGFKGPAQPSPCLGDALNAGYL
jgi:hypothetical protein